MGEAAVWLLAGLTAAATLYSLAVVAACGLHARRRRSAPAAPRETPPVSILKPIRGVEAGLENNLRSHFAQDYPSFEILFGVASADDSALAAIERVGREFPGRPSATVVGAAAGVGGNRKIALLEALAVRASHGLLLVDDADIRVPPDWLRRTVAALDGPGAGLVTCLYRARPGRTLGSKLEALGVSSDFAGQALVGFELARVPFALGATMLVRREELERIGGFAALRPYLADDYQLGARIAALGKRIVLSPVAVETGGEPTLGEAWRRRLRWARTVRASRPGGHAGFGVTLGGAWSLALVALEPAGWPLAAAYWAARAAAGVAAARTAGARLGWNLLLLPAADLWAFAAWAASFLGRSVEWRGRKLTLDRGGRIVGEETAPHR
jgi:ceramide glucosyltransferase